MGPRLGRRGRPGNGAGPGRLRGCFNGATAGSPWKTWRSLISTTAGTSFNGATAWSPWKTSRNYSPWDRDEELQWGHGLVAVEDEFDRRLLELSAKVLQWGHGLVAVED